MIIYCCSYSSTVATRKECENACFILSVWNHVSLSKVNAKNYFFGELLPLPGPDGLPGCLLGKLGVGFGAGFVNGFGAGFDVLVIFTRLKINADNN